MYLQENYFRPLVKLRFPDQLDFVIFHYPSSKLMRELNLIDCRILEASSEDLSHKYMIKRFIDGFDGLSEEDKNNNFVKLLSQHDVVISFPRIIYLENAEAVARIQFANDTSISIVQRNDWHDCKLYIYKDYKFERLSHLLAREGFVKRQLHAVKIIEQNGLFIDDVRIKEDILIPRDGVERFYVVGKSKIGRWGKIKLTKDDIVTERINGKFYDSQ